MLRRQLVAGAVGRADHQRTADLAAEHRADLRGVVDHLIHGDQQEVDRHDLDDRALAEHRRADAGTDEALFGDRRVADAVGAELLEQAGGHLVGAVEYADLLAHYEHASVAVHLLAHRQAQCLAVAHRRVALARAVAGAVYVRGRLGRDHSPKPPAKTSSRSPNGAPGNIRANWVALPGAYMPLASVLIGGGGLASAVSTAACTAASAAPSSASSSASGTPS